MAALERLARRTGATLSPHAEQRRTELGYSEAEIHQCLARPEQTYTCPDRYGAQRRMYQRADLAVVVHEPTRLVVTVLPRTGQTWVHGVDRRATLFRRGA